MISIANKKKYIIDKYVRNIETQATHKSYNGHQIQKGKRLAKPFSSFYPNPNRIKKGSGDN